MPRRCSIRCSWMDALKLHCGAEQERRRWATAGGKPPPSKVSRAGLWLGHWLCMILQQQHMGRGGSIAHAQ